MNYRFYAIFALIIVGCLSLQPAAASALSLRMQPLLYKATLSPTETKKGFVDVSNTSGRDLTLTTSVQAFRQTDERGSLQFYNDPKIQAGLIPDLQEFTLKPGEAIHLAFLLDGRKLPTGDVFAALFVATKPTPGEVMQESVRLGTLFTLVNGKAGARQADITALHLPVFNFGQGVSGSYRIKNTADPQSVNGFYPTVMVSVQPFDASAHVASPLVMAGNSREVPFSLTTARFGLYKVQAGYEGSVQARWAFFVTGYWRWLAPLLLVLVASLAVFIRRGRVFARHN